MELANCPAGQRVQDDAPAPATKPLEHGSGDVEPTPQRLPTGHCVISAGVAQKEPAGHVRKMVDRAGQYCPTSHGPRLIGVWQ
jgi:hypothetical protein